MIIFMNAAKYYKPESLSAIPDNVHWCTCT